MLKWVNLSRVKPVPKLLSKVSWRQRRRVEEKWEDRTIIKLFIFHGCCWLTLRLDTLNVKHAGALASLHRQLWVLSLAFFYEPLLAVCLGIISLEISQYDLLNVIHKATEKGGSARTRLLSTKLFLQLSRRRCCELVNIKVRHTKWS